MHNIEKKKKKEEKKELLCTKTTKKKKNATFGSKKRTLSPTLISYPPVPEVNGAYLGP